MSAVVACNATVVCLSAVVSESEGSPIVWNFGVIPPPKLCVTGQAQQQVVAMINRLRGNINYKCKLGNKPGLCCPGENECYFDRNIPRPLLHNQCKFPNQRCATKGNGGICENNSVCTTSAICHEAAKPICDEERRCAPCKQNEECFKKSNDIPFCVGGKCVQSSACSKGKRTGGCGKAARNEFNREFPLVIYPTQVNFTILTKAYISGFF